MMLLLKSKRSCFLPSSSTAGHKTTTAITSYCFFRTLVRFANAAAGENPAPKTPFMVEYLINSCGFSSEEAIKASKRLAHIKSPSNPDSVIHFLKQNGLSDVQIRSLISKYPRTLCARVEKTLGPKIRVLKEMGFSEPELAQLVSDIPKALRASDLQPKLALWKSLFRNREDLPRAIRKNPNLLTYSLGKRIMPTISLLRECGLPDSWIANMVSRAWTITASISRIKASVKRAEELGFSRGSGMFRKALWSLCISQTRFDAKVELLKGLGWSEAEVLSAIIKQPNLLTLSEKNICDTMKFLMQEAGCETSYVACHPILLMFSLERRLIPQNCVLRILKQQELLGRGYNLLSAFTKSDNNFIEKYILQHEAKVLGLHEDFVAACSGNFPSNGEKWRRKYRWYLLMVICQV